MSGLGHHECLVYGNIDVRSRVILMSGRGNQECLVFGNIDVWSMAATNVPLYNHCSATDCVVSQLLNVFLTHLSNPVII